MRISWGNYYYSSVLVALTRVTCCGGGNIFLVSASEIDQSFNWILINTQEWTCGCADGVSTSGNCIWRDEWEWACGGCEVVGLDLILTRPTTRMNSGNFVKYLCMSLCRECTTHWWLPGDLIRGPRAGLIATLPRLLVDTLKRVFRQKVVVCY